MSRQIQLLCSRVKEHVRHFEEDRQIAQTTIICFRHWMLELVLIQRLHLHSELATAEFRRVDNRYNLYCDEFIESFKLCVFFYINYPSLNVRSANVSPPYSLSPPFFIRHPLVHKVIQPHYLLT